MFWKTVRVDLAMAMLVLFVGSSQAAVVNHNSYEDSTTHFNWKFNWTGETDGLTGFTMDAPNQEEWRGVRLEFNFENDRRNLQVVAIHKIAPPSHSHPTEGEQLNLVVDVRNLAYTTSITRIANGIDAVQHDTHGDWMRIYYQRPFGSDLVQFEVQGIHENSAVLPEPASGLVAAGLLCSVAILRRRKRPLVK